MMTWLVCLVCGLAGAGLVLLLGDWFVAVFRMSTFEGGAGYLMVFVFTPLAFLGGLIVGGVSASRFGSTGYFVKQGFALLMTVIVFWAVVGVAYLCNPPRPPPPPLSEEEKSQALLQAKEAMAKAEQEEEARFQALTPDSSLGEYLDAVRRLSPVDAGDERYEARQAQVLAGAARIKSRQRDAIELLNSGAIGRLKDLWRYSLAATPELCAAYNRAFVQYAGRDDLIVSVIRLLTPQLANLKWLAGEHCDVDESLAAFTEILRRGMGVTDSSLQEQLHIGSSLATLAELRTKR